MTFQKDADQIYPGWKDKLGYTGESTVQAATFDWKKNAAAAAFFGSVYAKHKTPSKYCADVGLFRWPPRTSRATDEPPETIGPDSHVRAQRCQFPPARRR